MTVKGRMESDHCFTPSWCRCPDDPMCRLCKQGRCPVDDASSASSVSPSSAPERER